MFGFPVGVVTQVGLVGIFVLLIAFGLLIPRWTVSKMTKLLETRGDYFKEAYEKSDARQDVNAAQTEKLLTGMETTNKLLNALNEKVGS